MKKKIILLFSCFVLGFVFFFSKNVLAKDAGVMNIETPGENAIVGDSVYIEGWALSDYPNTKVRVSIDNKSKTAERLDRPDVLNAYKTYNNSNNTQPGFFATLDISDLSYGSKTIKVEILNDKNEAVFTKKMSVVKKAPMAIMNIEVPSNNAKLSDSLYVEGWMMSNASNTTAKIYVDKDKEGVLFDRKERPDVLNLVQGYGDVRTNPTPGFYNTIDISSLGYGTHKYTIKIFDKNNNVIKEESRSFEITKPEVAINIETPSNNAKLSDSLYVEGWMMSNASNTTAKIYVDQDKEGVLFDRKERPDVLNSVQGYGDVRTNPTPGFYKNIDINNLGYGTHKYTIKIFDKNNNVIKEESRSFEITKPEVMVYIETPSNNSKASRSLYIEGWMMSNVRDVSIHLLKGNEDLGEVSRLIKRPDVLNSVKGYGDASTNPIPGFSKTVDLSKYEDGNVTLTIDVRDKKGNSLEKQNITVKLEKYKTTINSITPEENTIFDNTITGKGTITTDAPNVTFNATIDGETMQSTFDGTNYSFSYDKVYDKLDGNHLIKLNVVSNEETIMTKEISIEVKKNYEGTAVIDYIDYKNVAPATEIIKSDGVLNILGWVLTNDSRTSIDKELKVFIDGKEQSETINRSEGDYLYEETSTAPHYIDPYTSVKGKDMGRDPIFTVDLSKVSNGNHNLTIEIYNHLGELIGTATRNFQLYSGYSRGIDVSKYQRNINWNTVKNSGIDFVMVRAGYTGYGFSATPKTVTDSYAESHITGAYSAGLKVGVYYFTQALGYNEGVIEANYLFNNALNFTYNGVKGVDMLDKTIPIAIDVETSSCASDGPCPGRADMLNLQQRTDAVRGFVDTVKSKGYKAMVYASTSWLEGYGRKIDLNQINEDDVWLSDWRTHSPDVRPNYSGRYTFWQWGVGGRGSIPTVPGIGISGDDDGNGVLDVDLDIRYD